MLFSNLSSLICLVCLISLGAATSVQFRTEDVTALKEQVKLLKADVQEESRRDKSLLQERIDDAKYSEKEEAAAILAHTQAQNATRAAQVAHDKFHSDLNKIKVEYATNRLVRDKETKTINSISDEIDNLVKIGKGTIGDKGAATQASELLQTGLLNLVELEKSVKPTKTTNLLQTDDSAQDLSAQLAEVVAQVSRKSPHVASMQDSLKTLLAKLKDEESKDTARVNVHSTTAQTKTSKLAEAKAAEETRYKLMEDAKAAKAAADAALAEQQKTYKDSSVVRQKELDKLEQVTQELDKLVAVRAGSEEMELLQTDSSKFDAIIADMKKKLAGMRADVELEETFQLKLKTMREKEVNNLMVTSAATETAYKQQVAETKELRSKRNTVKGEMEAAEGQLAAERATALQERRMIKQLQVTIKQFSTSSVTALGDCPEHEGLVCSGQGTCDTNSYTCKCPFSRSGKACQYCKYGYKFVAGVCLKSSFKLPDLSLLQGKTTLDDVSPADMDVMLLQLQTGARTGRVYAEMSSIDQLLTALLQKLTDAEKQLVQARDRHVVDYSKAKEKYHASLTSQVKKAQAYAAAHKSYKTEQKKMRLIRAMYDYEHPLRTKELASIDSTIKLLDQLAGITQAPSAPVAPALIQLPVTNLLSAQ